MHEDNVLEVSGEIPFDSAAVSFVAAVSLFTQWADSYCAEECATCPRGNDCNWRRSCRFTINFERQLYEPLPTKSLEAAKRRYVPKGDAPLPSRNPWAVPQCNFRERA